MALQSEQFVSALVDDLAEKVQTTYEEASKGWPKDAVGSEERLRVMVREAVASSSTATLHTALIEDVLARVQKPKKKAP